MQYLLFSRRLSRALGPSEGKMGQRNVRERRHGALWRRGLSGAGGLGGRLHRGFCTSTSNEGGVNRRSARQGDRCQKRGTQVRGRVGHRRFFPESRDVSRRRWWLDTSFRRVLVGLIVGISFMLKSLTMLARSDPAKKRYESNGCSNDRGR